MWIHFPADTHSWIGDAIGWYLCAMLMRINSVDTHVWKYEKLLSLVLSTNQSKNRSINQSINESIDHENIQMYLFV